MQDEEDKENEHFATRSDLDFINDKIGDENDLSDDELKSILQCEGHCQSVIYIEPDGSEVRCNNLCNPAEQLCHLCRLCEW